MFILFNITEHQTAAIVFGTIFITDIIKYKFPVPGACFFYIHNTTLNWNGHYAWFNGYTTPSCGRFGMGSNWAVPTWNGLIMDSYRMALLFLSSCSQYNISILSHFIFSSYGRPCIRNIKIVNNFYMENA